MELQILDGSLPLYRDAIYGKPAIIALRPYIIYGTMVYGVGTAGINGGINIEHATIDGVYWTIATRDGMYMESNYIYLMAWLSYGSLEHGVSRCGLSSLNGGNGLSFTIWFFATK